MTRTARRLGLALLFAAAAGAAAAADSRPAAADCQACHETGARTGRRKAGDPPPYNAAALKSSPHASLECVDCHADIKEVPHPDKLARVDCGSCHGDEQKQFAQSVHGRKAAAGDLYAPG